MSKTYFFLSGLPRGGSTLLSSILNQNPDIYCSPEQSLVCDFLYQNEQYFNNSEEYQSWTNESGKDKILTSIIQNFYSHRSEKYIIDKCRTWGTPYNLDLIKKYITEDIKIICPVRPILEILASFIKLFHASGSGGLMDNNIYSNNRLIYRPIDDVRCDEIMMPNGPTDKALFSLSQHKNYDGLFHLVEYDDLVYNTEKTIRNIYDFLEIKYFDHSFENLSNSDEINHEFYGIENLHKIRPNISRTSTKPEDILSDYVIQKYSNYEIWR